MPFKKPVFQVRFKNGLGPQSPHPKTDLHYTRVSGINFSILLLFLNEKFKVRKSVPKLSHRFFFPNK
jgi:hypothetical protein